MGKPTAVGTGPSKGPTGGAQGPHPPADAEVLQIAYDLLHRDVEEAIERLEDVVSDLRWAAFRGETDSDQLYRLVERFEDIAGRLQEGLEVADGTLTAEDDDC